MSLDRQITLKSGRVIPPNLTNQQFAELVVLLSRNEVRELCYQLHELRRFKGFTSTVMGQKFHRTDLENFAAAMWRGESSFPLPDYCKSEQTASNRTIDPDSVADYTGESNQPEIDEELELDQHNESDVVTDLRSVLERIGVCSKPVLDSDQISAIVRSQIREATEKAFESVLSLSESFNALLERTHKLESELSDIKENKPRRIEIVDQFGEVRLHNALSHKSFDRLFNYVKAGLATDKDGNAIAPNSSRNIMLVGPAGAGKTFVCEQIATALGLRFSFNGAIGDEFKVLGFKDATGEYVETEFYETYTGGGIHLWDELDGSSPNACLALNAFLANGKGDFPRGKNGNGGVRNRAKNNIIIASCNVWHGATSDYVGRFQMDEAFKNRFGVRMLWDYDERLEKELAGDDKWTRFVQGCRANIKKHGVKKHIISPRASETGAHSLRCGIPWETVVEDCVRCGLPDAQWNLVKEGL